MSVALSYFKLSVAFQKYVKYEGAGSREPIPWGLHRLHINIDIFYRDI